MNLRKQLAGHWTCDSRDTSNGTLRDRSGYGNHGTLNGGLATGRVDSPVGEAYSVDGTDDWVVASPQTQLDGASGATFAYWVSYDASASDFDLSGYIDGNANTADDAIRLGRSSGGSVFLNPGTHSDQTMGYTFSTSTWYHLAISIDCSAGKAIVYVDGEQIGSTTSGVPTSMGMTVDLGIGASNEGGYNHGISGKIANARLYARPLSADEINALANQRTPRHKGTPTESALAGVQGHWPLADQSGPAEDLSANQNDGTLYNGITTAVDGPTGHCMEFDGTDDEIIIPHSSKLNPSQKGGWTLMMWIQWLEDPSVKDASNDIIAKREGSSGDAWTWHMTDVYINDGNWQSFAYPQSAWKQGEWQHVAWTWDGDSSKVYFDGEVVSSGSHSAGDATGGNGIGIAKFYGAGTHDNFRLADLRMYSRDLGDHEIRSVYDAGLPCTEAGLAGHWTMDDADTSSGTLYDRSPKSNDGTLQNGVTTGVTGQINEAYGFDGSSTQVDLPSSVDSTSFTVAFWAETDVLDGTHRRVFESRNSNNNVGFTIGVDSGNNWQFYSNDGSGHALDASASTNTWTHIVATYDGSTDTKAFWKNGQKVVGATKNIDPDTTGSATIGNDPHYSEYWDGTIDEVRVYNRALSPKAIRSLYRTRAAYYEGGPGNTSPRTLTGGTRL